MRFSISRLTLVEIGGWITLGLLFWLLLNTHNALAHPLTPATPALEAAATLPPASIIDDQQPAPPQAQQTAQHKTNQLFWQTRLRLRHDLPVRGVMGYWMPSRSRYYLAERRRFLKREAMRPKPVVLPRRGNGNMGPALGSVYCRPLV